MRQLASVILFFPFLIPVGCGSGRDGTQLRPIESAQAPLPRETAFGSLGDFKIGDFEGQIPFYLDGDLMVYLPLSGYPGKAFGPAYVLVMRLPHTGTTLYDSGMIVSSDFLHINPAQLDSKGRTFRFNYGVSGKPLVEQFSVGDKNYPPEAGRVFLIDLTADPPIVNQLLADLADLPIVHPGSSPSRDDLKAAVEKLSGKDKVIRDFVASIEKK
jgi:hypothetical protein